MDVPLTMFVDSHFVLISMLIYASHGNQTHPIINNFQTTIIPMAANSIFKDGNVYTFQIPQNSANYQIRAALTPKGLWVCIE